MTDHLVLADVIRAAALRQPGRTAIVDQYRELTYADLEDLSNRAGNALRDLGLTRHDRAAFLSTNRSEFYELMFGAAKIGVATVPINWRLAPPEIAAVLENADPDALLVEEQLLHLVPHELAERLSGRLVTIGGSDPVAEWSDLLRNASGAGPVSDTDPQDVMLQLYTSGTTGVPKGVMLTHSNLMSVIDDLADAWHFGDGSVVYVPYPSFHAVGSFWPVLTMHRTGTVLLRPSFDPEDFLDAVESRSVTLAMMVPAVLNMVLRDPAAPNRRLESLKHIVYGASPISQDVLNRAIELLPGCSFHHAYGLTECTGTVTTMSWAEHVPGTERMKSCGRPLPWVEVRIVDPRTGSMLGVGEVGEVCVRSPTVMKGYFRAPVETENVLGSGWLRTGDAGYFDSEGYLFLTDRLHDVIISGGENIYPAEVENVLFSHPRISDACVVGVGDDRWGEVVLAVVVPCGDEALDPHEVIRFCRKQLAAYKCPTYVELSTNPLPLGPTGKVLRSKLRSHARELGHS